MCAKKNFSKHKINVRTDSKVFLVLSFYLPSALLLFHVFRFLSLFMPAEDIKAKRAAEMDVNLSSSLICAEKNTHMHTHPTAVMDWGCENWQPHKKWTIWSEAGGSMSPSPPKKWKKKTLTSIFLWRWDKVLTMTRCVKTGKNWVKGVKHIKTRIERPDGELKSPKTASQRPSGRFLVPNRDFI